MPDDKQIELPVIENNYVGNKCQGRDYWRSIEELQDSDEFRQLLENEFPAGASLWDSNRREFLTLMGASLALAGFSGCRGQQPEKIIPYVDQPELIVPGKPLYYTTAMSTCGVGTGLLVQSYMGRPTKIEGNPKHPSVPVVPWGGDEQTAPGVSDIFSQASILNLYDPDRSQTIKYGGAISTWDAFLTTLKTKMDGYKSTKGRGIRFLTESISSPTLSSQFNEFKQLYPEAQWHQFEPVNHDNDLAGSKLAFGEYVVAHYNLKHADVIVAFDCDLLTSGPEHLRYANEFAERRSFKTHDDRAEGLGSFTPPQSVSPNGDSRQVIDSRGGMNRLYALECTPSLTGAKADHRLPVSVDEIELFTVALARKLGVSEDLVDRTAAFGSPVNDELNPASQRLDAIADDLLSIKSNDRSNGSLIAAGPHCSPRIHALVNAMNEVLGNIGKTISYTRSVSSESSIESLRTLVADMNDGKVELLCILGGNPVYNSPADLRFSDAMAKVPLRIRLGEYDDETSFYCHWHIPQTHYLESWSDTRGADGTVSIVQPLIAPLYLGKTAHELLSTLMGKPGRKAYDLVKEYWHSQLDSQYEPEVQARESGSAPEQIQPEAQASESANLAANNKIDREFEVRWQTALHEGLLPETAFSEIQVSTNNSPLLGSDGGSPENTSPTRKRVNPDSPQTLAGTVGQCDIVFRPDPTVFDGRFANNGWLQELPKPFNKLTWENAALISPQLAGELSLKNGDVLEFSLDGSTLRAPVWIQAGQSAKAVTLHFGYGRSRAGRVGSNIGFNAYAFQSSDSPWHLRGVAIKPTGEHIKLAVTQHHHLMEGRDLVREVTLADVTGDSQPRDEHHANTGTNLPTLYSPEEHQYDGYKWGMTIDLNRCIGCNACMVACQSENNIPVVGKDQVSRGREMHWIRIDSYYQGEPENPRTVHQPVPCMHCENAPCEVVCPVGATVHGSEGLNEMVYNRCVGTRYCSNNCPYKVRRFNFLQYSDTKTPSLKLLNNPNVTVRNRGVMEKCTYCVQRISAARIQSEKEDRTIRDSEVVTACQAACPSQAIVFGDLNDPNSRIAQTSSDRLNYSLLEELNTRPRTTYLATVRNPNPKLE